MQNQFTDRFKRKKLLLEINHFRVKSDYASYECPNKYKLTNVMPLRHKTQIQDRQPVKLLPIMGRKISYSIGTHPAIFRSSRGQPKIQIRQNEPIVTVNRFTYDSDDFIDYKSEYKYVLIELDNFFKSYNDKEFKLSRNAKFTSVVSLLKNHVSALFFVGFYEVVDCLDLTGKSTGIKQLEVGAYQSTILATPRIAHGKGQCGQCWSEAKVQVVQDVKECKNYIACDDETQSEIVLPIFNSDNEVIAVLDIDSDQKGRFTEEDVEYLQQIVSYLYK